MDKQNRVEQTKKNDNVEQLMVEAANELGVSADTRNIQENPEKFASRLKRLIRAVK
ncbi:hypothetical protein MK805_02990 [Shimazuella sp. AN120528]|uniref:hypothetical protein n=1 Tax=Shimazuella soli TaxID=1892854 RepID=UPI001F117D98|nr:hypothetical protein [Shimazuella soli]MCH5583933.1 hypothetical protein [Shimazuella soli]